MYLKRLLFLLILIPPLSFQKQELSKPEKEINNQTNVIQSKQYMEKIEIDKNITLKEKTELPTKKIVIDKNITFKKEKETKEEIIAKLNRMVEEGMVAVSINTFIECKNGKGFFNICNDCSNKCSQVVKIYDEVGRRIYESKIIPAGEKIEIDSLNVELPKGIHNCTAYIKSIDSSNNIVGKVGVEVKVEITE